MSVPAGGPLLFVSYAREDKELCRRLVLLLGLVLKARGYDVWWDQTMVSGRWRDQIDAALNRTVAGVLFVSEHSLTSEFVMEHELPALLDRGPVAPVYGRPCPWQNVPSVAELQFLGSTERSLAELDDARGELTAALSDLARQAPDFLGLRPVTAEPAPAPLGAGGHAAEVIVTEQAGALHGVPELPPGYFERTADLEGLRARLLAPGAGGVLGVHGVGGIGKTVLATAVARDATVRRAFPDGVYWVTLGERADPVAAQATLAGLAGVDARFRTVEDGRAALGEALGGRRALVVVDDVWSAADSEALLVAGAAGRVMVTTRHPLILHRLRADQAPVDRLGRPEALRFLAHATRHPEPLPPEAEALVDELGGVVLALALVGATVAHGTSWSDALAAVREAAATFADDSFANQFKAMQLAWDALDGDARRRYGELAVFGEDVVVPATTVARLWRHTAGLDRAAADDLRAALAGRNLLMSDGDGVRFHDLQRAFLQLRTPDSALAHGRLLAAHAGVPRTAERWSTLPDDEPYLWDHLVEHLVAAGDVAALEEILVDPVWLVRRYHRHGPHAPEADLLRGLEALPTYAAATRMLHRLRQVSHLVGAVPTLADRALTLAHQVGDLVPTSELAALFPRVRLSPLRLLRADSDALERVVTGSLGGVWSVAWSPDGRLLASAGVDGAVRLWETGLAGRRAGSLAPDGPVRSAAWSPDGRLATAGDDGVLRVWVPGAPAEPAVALSGHVGAVWSVAWSPDGRRLASAGSDATVRVWDPAGAAEAVSDHHEGTVWSVAWSPDGRLLASGGVDGAVRLWTLGGAEPSTVLGRHDGWVWSVAWSPDGRRVASGGDRTVRLWDAAREGPPVVLAGHADLVWSVAWSPDGREVASGSSDGSVRTWDGEAGREQAVLCGHEHHVWSVAWSPDGGRLASGSHDETVRVWDPGALAAGPPRASLRACWVWSVAWSPDGRQVATGAEDGTVRVWDAEAPASPPAVVADLDGGVWGVAWSPDGRRLAAAGADRVIRVWAAGAWDAPLLELAGHGALVRSVQWSPDGRRLATVADDGTVRVWDAHGAAQPPGVVLAPGDRVRGRALAWSPDGRRLASGHEDGALRLWDPGAPSTRPTVRGGHAARVEALAWSPDGRWLASASLDGTVRLWDASGSADDDAVLVGHEDPVTAVAWSPDGRRLASGGEDRTVRLWDPAEAAPVSALGVGGMVCSLAWHGARIAVGTATTWTLLAVEDDGPGRAGAAP